MATETKIPDGDFLSPQKEQLYSAFTDALERTKAEVAQMQEKLKKYDEKLEASKTVKEQGKKAQDYLQSTLDEIKTTLESLGEKAQEVFQQSKDVSLKAVKDLKEQLQKIVSELQRLAKEFDEKHGVSSKVSELTAPVVSLLQTFHSSFESSLEKAVDRAKEAGESGTKYLIEAAASLETKYSLESRMKGIDEKYGISETARKVQERTEEFLEKQNVKEKVKELDEKYTKSRLTGFVESGMQKVNEIAATLEKEYETAKENQKQVPAA